MFSEEQIDAANQLLLADRDRLEASIRYDIVQMLDTMSIDYELEYQTDSGPADIYLYRMRVFLETKASGLADHPDNPQPRENKESPRAQLERYILSEITREMGMLELDGFADRKWVGILTDGHLWHAWSYDHDETASATQLFRDFRPKSSEELLQKLSFLTTDEPIGKPWIPANPRSVFQQDLIQLDEIYTNLPKIFRSSTETKINLWLEMLRTACMEPENDASKHKLFVRHTFLVCLARGIVFTLTSPSSDIDSEEVLGDGFIAWVIESTKGKNWSKAFLQRIQQYEWRRRRGDVLRSLYEQIVDPIDRKIFGEYYTPDWIAEWLVEEVLDDNWCEESVKAVLNAEENRQELSGVGVLDPTCGSGTFLYFAAKRILDSPTIANLSVVRKSTIVARLVNGIDVHPVAAEISRATILRALPAQPRDGVSDIRVYEGDSLLIMQDDEHSLFFPRNGEVRITTPKGEVVDLPKSFVDHPSFTENLRRMIIYAKYKQDLPSDILLTVPTAAKPALSECHEKFKTIIAKEGNSVWTWFISNAAGPYRLAQKKINRIVANPPWVAMKDIQNETRKRALENFAQHKLNLWTGGKQAPHFDIAQLFVKRVRQLYLKNEIQDPAIWIVKKSALRAGNWDKFREWHQPYLAQSLDMEEVRVFGSGDARRCCVLLEIRRSKVLFSYKSSRVIGRCSEDRPDSGMNLDEAKKLLSFDEMEVKPPNLPSQYLDRGGKPLFRQGATITPSVLTIVDNFEECGNSNVKVTTSSSSHNPWRSIQRQTGELPKHWLRDLLKSQNLLPFAIVDQHPLAIIPTNSNGNLQSDDSNTSEFWNQLDAIYQEHRGTGRSTPKTLVARINFGNIVNTQLTLNVPQRNAYGNCVVLYPRSGDIMRAARCQNFRAIVDSSLYHWTASSEEEAAYLVAILNAPCLRQTYVDSRESGRDFHLHHWRKIPIAQYDENNEVHSKIADVTVKAEAAAADLITNVNLSVFGQQAMSSRIRSHLEEEGISTEIDELVEKLLPKYVT